MNHQQLIDYQKRTLAKLIKEVSAQNGGDDPQFLDEYIAEVVKEWSNDLSTAIACFTDLKSQKVMSKDTKSNMVSKDTNLVRPKGHGAFREHYEGKGSREQLAEKREEVQG